MSAMEMRKKEPLTLALCTFRDVFVGGRALGDVDGEDAGRLEAFALEGLFWSVEAGARFPSQAFSLGEPIPFVMTGILSY